MKKKFLIISSLILLVCISSVFLRAQTDKLPEKVDPTDQEVESLRNLPKHGLFSITFSNMVPQDDFMKNLNKTGQGFSILGGYSFDPIPVTVGLDLNFFFIGSDTRYYYYNYTTPIGVVLKYADTIELSNTMIPLNAFVRIQPNLFDWVFPYVEGIAGISFLSGSLEYKSDSRLINNTNKKSDNNTSWNYGVGAGLAIKFADIFNLPSQHIQFLADLKLRFMMGTETEYTQYEYNETNKQVEETKFKSKTDFVHFSLGFTVRF